MLADAELELHTVTRRLEKEIQLLLDDAAAGRWDNPQSVKHADFLKSIPEPARRIVEDTGPLVVWCRNSCEQTVQHLEFARFFFITSKTVENRRLLDVWIREVIRVFGLKESRCHITNPANAIDHRTIPEGVELSFDLPGIGGVHFSRDGVRRDGGPGRGGGGNGGGPEAFLRQLAEFTSADRRRIFEALQREFGGEMERRRERSGGRPAAPSAACLLIPPPLLILEGVLHPMPPGINPLVFPPPIEF